MNDYLKKILAVKQQEVVQLKENMSIGFSALYSGKKSFKDALLSHGSVIAEIKRKSPSQSHIGDISDPVKLAKQYEASGAAAISVLTDYYGFGGSLLDLKNVETALRNTSCPILRKDFMIDPIQISQSVMAGADAVLLIVSVLAERTEEMLSFAKQSRIDAIVEVHNQQECEHAVAIGAEIIGVNNRDLETFETQPDCALELISLIPDHIVKVAESGMRSPTDALRYLQAGYDSVLIGEALVKAEDPGKFIAGCQLS
jgi:indole-3-glycerol phosphate synthase